jgi:hypothetical protein
LKRAIVPAIDAPNETMDDTQYLQHCRALWREFAGTLNTRTAQVDAENPLRELALEFSNIEDAELYANGPALVMRLFTHQPEFAPTFPRTLLWFLGGDCLHVLTDDEVVIFQALDEARLASADRGEMFDYHAAAAKRLQLT